MPFFDIDGAKHMVSLMYRARLRFLPALRISKNRDRLEFRDRGNFIFGEIDGDRHYKNVDVIENEMKAQQSS